MYIIMLSIYANGNPEVKRLLYFSNSVLAKGWITQNFPDFEQAGDDIFVKEEDGETKYFILKERH